MSEIRIDCSYCVIHGKTPDTKRHLYINTINNLFFCQRCGEHGIWDDMTPIVGAEVSQDKFADVDIFKFDINPIHMKAMREVREKVLVYGITRLPQKVIYEKCGWSPDLPNRLFFPIWHPNIERVVVCWQGRAIDDEIKPKYLTHGLKAHYIYEYDNVKEWAVLTEGPIDALSTPHGIAIFGKCLSDQQIGMIGSKYNRVYWMLDKDTLGDDRVKAQKNKLRAYTFVEEIPFSPFEGKDAGEIGYERMVEKLRKLGEII